MLVDWEINQAIEKGNIKVTPFDKSLVNPNSLDIRLGRQFSSLRPAMERYELEFVDGDGVKTWIPRKVYPIHPIVNPSNKESFYFDTTEKDEYILEPGGFILASLQEDITLCSWICAEIRGKSSLGRLGLINSAHAGWVDAGWSGVLTIELSNVGNLPLKLTAGMKIGQMLFHYTATPNKDYGVTGRYNRQEPGQGSLGV